VILRDLTPKRDFTSARDCPRALSHLAESERLERFTSIVATGDSISITEKVNLYLDLARVRSLEVKYLPADDERWPVREQGMSNACFGVLGRKPEETLRQSISHPQDAERKRA
jgi:nucleoside-diphosphate-sugar epimerase